MKISFFSSNNEVLTEIGKRIKSQRISMNMTQKEIAEKTNLTQKTISNLENGKDVSFTTVIDVNQGKTAEKSFQITNQEK